MSRKMKLSIIGVFTLIFVAFFAAYGILFHIENKAAAQLKAHLKKSEPSLKFSYDHVSMNPFALFDSKLNLVNLKIAFANGESITSSTAALSEVEFNKQTLSSMRLLLKGLRVKQPGKTEPQDSPFGHLSFNADLTITKNQGELYVKVLQKRRPVLFIHAAFTNLPTFTKNNFGTELSELGETVVQTLHLKVSWPFNLPLKSVHLPPSVKGGLLAMGYQDLPLYLSGETNYSSHSLRADSSYNLLLNYGFDVLLQSKNRFKKPVTLGHDFALLANPTVAEFFTVEDNKFIQSAKLQYIDQGFTNKLIGAIANMQNQKPASVKMALRSELGNMIGASSIPQVKSTFIAIQQFLRNPKNITVSITPKTPMPATFPLKFFIVRKANEAKFVSELKATKSAKERTQLMEEFQAHENAGLEKFLKLIGYQIQANQ